MRERVLIALIAAGPPTLAAIMGYLANSRSLRRTAGEAQSVPVVKILDRIEGRIEQLEANTSAAAQRLAFLEGANAMLADLSRDVERLSDDLDRVRDRVARIEGAPA